MIGVAANSRDIETATEFFELFKTPWEPVVPGRDYSVVLSTGLQPQEYRAPVVVMYASAGHGDRLERHSRASHTAVELRLDADRFPVYGAVASFESTDGPSILSLDGRAVDHFVETGSQLVCRVGYDLFEEVRFLLELGQPAAYAPIPTLEFHIECLRRILLKAGVAFIEVPPRPRESDFVCCLTHDLDFYGIRRHPFDATMAGFVARSSVGTLVDWIKGRRPATDVFRNWQALLSLPLVFLGLAPDPWKPIDDYEEVEHDRPSTYFVIPFKGRPGVSPSGSVVPRRAVAYQASEIRQELREAHGRGREIALHGIDAWRDTEAGRAEMKEIGSIVGPGPTGVRMHWLYGDSGTPERLEEAGFDYDSTWGYNDTIGFRPGTSQVFRLSGTRGLLELPLTIMDSALLFRGRSNLSPQEAQDRCSAVIAAARRFGGSIVINWHDRSRAPERLWGRTYDAVVAMIGEGKRAWFATAQQAVAWFRWRRSIAFGFEAGNRVRITAASSPSGLPACSVYVHRPAQTPAALERLTFDGRELIVQL